MSSLMQVGSMLPMKNAGSLRFAAGSAASDAAMCERAALANTTPCEISPASATIFWRSAAMMIGGNSPTPSTARSLSTKRARVAERLADGNAHALVARRMGHADAEAEAPAGDLVHERGTLREVQHGARIDRRDGGAERDALGVPRHRLALRHVAVHAGRVDAGEAAPLDVARDVDGQPAAAGNGNK